MFASFASQTPSSRHLLGFLGEEHVFVQPFLQFSKIFFHFFEVFSKGRNLITLSENFTVELNADGIIHIHQGNIRLDLPQSDWKILCDALVIAKEKVYTDERNPFITAGGIRLG